MAVDLLRFTQCLFYSKYLYINNFLIFFGVFMGAGSCFINAYIA
tara:strand:+ start:2940 stop:3071 length:132 start_codon:yes stop_codon:yes gene_type:complete